MSFCCTLSVVQSKLFDAEKNNLSDFQDDSLYLRCVEVVDALTPLLPSDPLLALPDGVHVAVVHAFAQQVLFQLEAAGAGGRVA